MKYLRLLLVLMVCSGQASGIVSNSDIDKRPLFAILVACHQPVAVILMDPYVGKAFVSSYSSFIKSKYGIRLAHKILKKLPKSKNGKPIVRLINVNDLVSVKCLKSIRRK